eukprot:COSAG05_NODE_1390_length_5002_cov_2.478075_2_plen_91_part_00
MYLVPGAPSQFHVALPVDLALARLVLQRYQNYLQLPQQISLLPEVFRAPPFYVYLEPIPARVALDALPQTTHETPDGCVSHNSSLVRITN